MTNFPVLKQTDLLTVRTMDGRQVFTYQDLAEGFQVEAARIRQAFSRNADAWDQGETGVYHFDTPSGTQEVRWFTARGAMRFCRHVKSGRSDALYNHLLDLWEAERQPRADRDPLSEVDRVAGMMGQMLPALAGHLTTLATEQAAIRERVEAVEARQAATDPREIEVRMFQLHQLKKLLVEGTADHQRPVTHPAFWRALKEHCRVGSFQNRAALDVPTMDAAIAYARAWCFERGTVPPATLFDGESKAG